jgi:hypothetical protein
MNTIIEFKNFIPSQKHDAYCLKRHALVVEMAPYDAYVHGVLEITEHGKYKAIFIVNSSWGQFRRAAFHESLPAAIEEASHLIIQNIHRWKKGRHFKCDESLAG